MDKALEKLFADYEINVAFSKAEMTARHKAKNRTKKPVKMIT